MAGAMGPAGLLEGETVAVAAVAAVGGGFTVMAVAVVLAVAVGNGSGVAVDATDASTCRDDDATEGETMAVGVAVGVAATVAAGRGLAVAVVTVAVGIGTGSGVALAAKDARTARAHGLDAGVVDPCCPASLETLATDGEVTVPPTKVREAPGVEQAEAATDAAAAVHEERAQGVLALKGVARDAPRPAALGLA